MDLETIVRKRSAALIASDVETLKEIMSETFNHIDAGGSLLNRTSYLENYVLSDQVKWISQEFEDISIHDYGDTTVVACLVHDQALFGGIEFDARLRATFVYVRQNDTWRCVFGQSTRIAP